MQMAAYPSSLAIQDNEPYEEVDRAVLKAIRPQMCADIALSLLFLYKT